jgi:hypothetical protein
VKSQLRFVMHPDDETSLIADLLRDQEVLFIDGPRWKSAEPETTRNISQIGYYCIIWSPADLPRLAAKFIPSCNDWYCRSEYATIQFLRSTISGNAISDGRLAIGTDSANQPSANGVKLRYKAMAKFIKKSCANSVIQWRNPELPEAPAGPSRSANPSKVDRSLWVGPAAMKWLAERPDRRITPVYGGVVVGEIVREQKSHNETDDQHA